MFAINFDKWLDLKLMLIPQDVSVLVTPVSIECVTVNANVQYERQTANGHYWQTLPIVNDAIQVIETNNAYPGRTTDGNIPVVLYIDPSFSSLNPIFSSMETLV